MDIKEEVRRRIAELTQFAYERGFRDGAQSALTEIENVAADDVAKLLDKSAAPLTALPKAGAAKAKPAHAKRGKPAKTSGKAKSPKTSAAKRGKPKTMVVQEALQGLLDAKGEARRDEVLAAARAENPKINKFDLGNGLRILVKQSKIRVSPDDSSILLPAA